MKLCAAYTKENSILLAAMHVHFMTEGYADTMPIRAIAKYCN